MPASGAFTFTDSTPLSHADSDECISLIPMISPLAALRTKYALPFAAAI
jgi:hypothetical protein